MKTIIEVDVPEFQIGQEVSIYFKDTMMIKGVVQEPSREFEDYENEIEDLHNQLDIAEYDKERLREEVTNLEAKIQALEQEPKTDMLYKIRAEIEDIFVISVVMPDKMRTALEVKEEALQIIDKYRAESEEV